MNSLNPKLIKTKREEKQEIYYDQDNYQNRHRSNSGDRRISFRGRAQYGQNYIGGNYGKTSMEEVEKDLGKDNIQEILEGMMEAVVVDQDQV